jgi:hypothetical protein
MTLINRRLFLFSVASAQFAPAKKIDERSFPNWTPEFVDQMLTESAWAKASTVSFELQPVRQFTGSSFAQIELPGGTRFPGSRPKTAPQTWPSGGGASSVRTEIYLTTRWSSALPVRQALALQEFGEDGLQSDKAVELLTRREPEYVLEVAGFPAIMIRQGAKRFEAELLKTARLIVPDRKPILAASAHVPEYGTHLVATLRFPRLTDLTAKDGTIELYTASGSIKLQQRFKLKQMIYEGNLEL